MCVRKIYARRRYAKFKVRHMRKNYERKRVESVFQGQYFSRRKWAGISFSFLLQPNNYQERNQFWVIWAIKSCKIGGSWFVSSNEFIQCCAINAGKLALKKVARFRAFALMSLAFWRATYIELICGVILGTVRWWGSVTNTRMREVRRAI